MTARSAGRAYVRRFVPAMVGYMVLIFVVITVVNRIGDSGWRYPLLLLPLVPLLFVLRAVAQFLRESDELQRQIQLEALAFAFGVGSLITFGYGLLQSAGLPSLPWLWVWPVYAVCWLVGLVLARRRY